MGPVVLHSEETKRPSPPADCTNEPEPGAPVGDSPPTSPEIDTICQTNGFLQAQYPPLNIRFVVQPVNEKDQLGVNHQQFTITSKPIMQSASSIDGDLMSTDDLNNPFGIPGSDPQAQLTVRSMASIGLGSSDGRKIHLRRVHTTGPDSYISPLISPQIIEGIPPLQWPNEIGKKGGDVDFDLSDSDSDASGEEHIRRGAMGSRRYGRRRKRHGGQLWGSRVEFLLACIGFAVGLGNIWRFPYTAYKSGGGAFLIPYCIMVFLCGIPLQVLELAVGQYTREGPVDAMRDICPLLSGVGVAMMMLSLLLSSYYSVVMAWAMLYLGSSFTYDLPWTHCNNTWNTENCVEGPLKINVTEQNWSDGINATNLTFYMPKWSSPGQEFFDRRILEITGGVDELGKIHWELVACLLAAWVLLYISLRKSVRWSGKAVYFTVTLPYLLLVALTVRALTLDGAHEGLRHLFYPDWSLLLNAEVWVNALSQTFMSVGVAYGSLMAFASYNRFHNPFISDAFCLSALNSITSLVTGIVTFAALGHTALVHDQPIGDSAHDGLGFSMVMYTTVVSAMPFPQFWAVLLFIVFICLGLDTQFATLEVVLLTLQRFLNLPQRCTRFAPDLVAVAVCVVCFLASLPYITQGGIYLMHLADYYVVTVGVPALAFSEAVATGVCYGASRLARNVREMTGHSPSPFLVVCWAGVTPMLILGVWIFHLIDLNDLTYDNGSYHFPPWTAATGWCVLALLLGLVPALAVLAVYQAEGKTFLKKLVTSTKSQIKECPCCQRSINGLKDTHSEVHLDDIGNGHRFAGFAAIAIDEASYQTITSSIQSPHSLRPPLPAQYRSDQVVVAGDDTVQGPDGQLALQQLYRDPLG